MRILFLIAMGALAGYAGGRLARCAPFWCATVSAGVSAFLGWRAAGGLPWWWVPVPLVVGWLAVPLAAADLTRRRLPNQLTVPAYPIVAAAIGLAAGFGPGPALALRAVAGAAAFGLAHALVRMIAPRAMGGGDVKLSGSLGAVLGAVGWPALAIAATLAAAITSLIALAQRSRTAPHGPGMLAATWLVAVFPGHLPGP